MDIETGKKAVQPSSRKHGTWVFDQGTIISVAPDDVETAESHFTFDLERYKDDQTHEEWLKIFCFYNGNENGNITTSISTLESDIKQFKKYGVVLEETSYHDLYKRIEMSYLSLKSKTVSLDKDVSRREELIDQVKAYVDTDVHSITQDFCYIRVNDFNEIARDCGYSDYEMKSLRSALAHDELIHVVSGRYAILTRIKDKPERVIAFYREKLGVEVPTKEDSRKAEKSDTDE